MNNFKTYLISKLGKVINLINTLNTPKSHFADEHYHPGQRRIHKTMKKDNINQI